MPYRGRMARGMRSPMMRATITAMMLVIIIPIGLIALGDVLAR